LLGPQANLIRDQANLLYGFPSLMGGKADLLCDFPSLIYHKSSLLGRFATLLGGKAEVENHKSDQQNDRSEVKNRQKHQFPPNSDEHCPKSDRRPPQSKTLARGTKRPANEQRLGLRREAQRHAAIQDPGANSYNPHRVPSAPGCRSCRCGFNLIKLLAGAKSIP